MNVTLDELKSTVSDLPVPDRTELADYLLCSLETPDAGPYAEWLAVAEQRVSDIRSGRVVGIPAEQVLASLRRPLP